MRKENEIEKRRLSKILAKCDTDILKMLAEPVMETHSVTILRKPAKTMVMIRMKETVAKAQYYLGEMLACEAMIQLGGSKGFALMAGDDLDKVLYGAVIDAALKEKIPECAEISKILLEQENKIWLEEQREIQKHKATQVKFETLDVSY